MKIKMLTRLKHGKYGIIPNQKSFNIDPEHGEEFIKNGWAQLDLSSESLESDSEIEAEGQEALLKVLKKKKLVKENLIKVNVKGEAAKEAMVQKSNTVLGSQIETIKNKVNELKEKVSPRKPGRPFGRPKIEQPKTI